MGDRAIVCFSLGALDGTDDLPAVYLHWSGCEVPELLARLREVMRGRDTDASYAAARFCALACEANPGNLSVGLFAYTADQLTTPAKLSHGDAGFIVVDVSKPQWLATVYRGYMPETQNTGALAFAKGE